MFICIPQTVLALRGFYLCSMQLAHIVAFRFGHRLSGYHIRMANAIKPTFVLFIPMANDIQPMFVVDYSDGKRYKTIVLFKQFRWQTI